MKNLIKKTADLSHGKQFAIKSGSLSVTFYLFWDSEDRPTIEIQKVQLSKRKLTLLETWLVESYADRDQASGIYEFRKESFLHPYEYRIKRLIKDSDAYKKFQAEINEVLDRYQDQFGSASKGSSFHEDIYLPAKELSKNEPSKAAWGS